MSMLRPLHRPAARATLRGSSVVAAAGAASAWAAVEAALSGTVGEWVKIADSEFNSSNVGGLGWLDYSQDTVDLLTTAGDLGDAAAWAPYSGGPIGVLSGWGGLAFDLANGKAYANNSGDAAWSGNETYEYSFDTFGIERISNPGQIISPSDVAGGVGPDGMKLNGSGQPETPHGCHTYRAKSVFGDWMTYSGNFPYQHENSTTTLFWGGKNPTPYVTWAGDDQWHQWLFSISAAKNDPSDFANIWKRIGAGGSFGSFLSEIGSGSESAYVEIPDGQHAGKILGAAGRWLLLDIDNNTLAEDANNAGRYNIQVGSAPAPLAMFTHQATQRVYWLNGGCNLLYLDYTLDWDSSFPNVWNSPTTARSWSTHFNPVFDTSARGSAESGWTMDEDQGRIIAVDADGDLVQVDIGSGHAVTTYTTSGSDKPSGDYGSTTSPRAAGQVQYIPRANHNSNDDILIWIKLSGVYVLNLPGIGAFS